MCDSTKSTSKDDDDIDIYSELPNFKYDENLLKLEGDNKALKTTVAELMKKVKTLEIQLKTCEKTNVNYRRNISMLFLSAKREIERKDRTISELRSRSFHNARRDFPRRNRIEFAGGQNISRNSEVEKTKSATSEPPVLNQPKKIGYIFTAGNSRSGLYKCQYPAKDNKAEVGGKSCKSDSVDSIKKTDCSKSVIPSNQIGDSKEIRSKDVKSVVDRNSVSANSSKITDNIKEGSKESNREGKKTAKEQTGISLKSKSTIYQDEKGSPMISLERNSSKSSTRSKSPIVFNRRRSPRTADGRSSPISLDRRKSPINLSRSKSPIVSNRRRSPRTSDGRKSSTTSDRRKSPRISVRRDVEKRSSSSSGSNLRSGSVLRKIDHRSRSIRSRSRISNASRHSVKRDSVSRNVGSRGKLSVEEKDELKECKKLGLGSSEVESVPGTQTKESEELKSVDIVVDDGKTMVDTSVVINSNIDTHLPSIESGIDVANHGEVIQVSENVMDTAEIKSPDESTKEAVNNQTTIENEELEKIKSLPPLIGPWTQFSVRRYKKLHGFSPVKPDNENKKIVNIKYIEKKNLFDNKIERTVVTEIGGEITKEILNIESDKGLESNKILESRCDGEITHKTLNIESVKDDEDTNKALIESNKFLESCSLSESCVSNVHNKDTPCNSNNHKLESELQSLLKESDETLSRENVISTTLESNKDNYSENEVMSSKSAAPSDQVFDSNADISHKIVNSELLVENVVPEETSKCIGNEKLDELLSEKCGYPKLLTNNHGNDVPFISITDNNTTTSVSVFVKENSKEIDSYMSGSDKDLKLVSEIEKKCHVDNGNQADNQDSTKVIDDVNVDATSTLIVNEDSKKAVNEKEICSTEREQLNLSTEKEDKEKTGQKNENVGLPCANVLLKSSTEDEDTEEIGGDKTCCEASSGNLQSSSENEVLESSVEDQEKNARVEKLDEVVHDTVKAQEIVESTHFKEGFIADSALNAFAKLDSPEIDELPTDKSDSKLTIEKPKIVDNISSSLHTFNSALDFSISTTNTNSLNADSTIEQQRQKAQLSDSSLQVVNALKKLPKIRENFLQLFGESSNQDNLKGSGTETPCEETGSKPCSTITSNKELKSLTCSSFLSSSSSSTSSSSSSSSSSLISQEKSSESTIPQVIRLFGIDITEEHSPFHVCKSSSQNSILEDKVDDTSHSTKVVNCLKITTDNNLSLENESEIITGKSDSVVVSGQVDEAVLEKKSIEIDCPLAQITIESKNISETKIVESCLLQENQEKTVISKEIICEEPVVFPVPIIVVDKVLDDKASNGKASSQENKVTGEYYSNFTEALRNETNVSISKTDVTQPEFQFESPSRYIMRINNNSVTSHKGLEITESQSVTGEDTMTMVRRLAKPPDIVSPIKTPSRHKGLEITESQSITGEDTLTMVKRLAKPLNTVSPIKTPSKRTISRNEKTSVSPDVSSVTTNKEKQDDEKVNENEKKLSKNERNLVENENKVVENVDKLAENENKFAENKNNLAENENKLAENKNKIAEKDRKLAESEGTRVVEHSKSVYKQEMKPNHDFIAKKDKVSVSLSSEHFEFRRRRSSRPIVKLKNSSSVAIRQNDMNKSQTNQLNEQKVEKQVTIVSKSGKINEQKLDKRPTSPSKKDIIQKISPLSSKKDSIGGIPSRLPTPKNDLIQENLPHQPPRKDSIEDKHLPSPTNAPNLLKRPLSLSRNESIQRTQGFKRRRVVINRLAQNDLIKLGSTNEKTSIETSVKNCEQMNLEKNRSPIASTSGLGRQRSLSGSADLKTSVKRTNDGNDQSPGKQQKVDNSVPGKRDDSTASGKGVNETSQHRHRNQGNVDSGPETSVARPTPKLSDTARSSKRSGVVDVKTDFCERRSPSEYFNSRSSMNRRYRSSLRDRNLQRCRSPLVSRRRVDKYLMNRRETRQRNETRNSARVAERFVNNDSNRRLSCDNSIKWKLKPIDVKLQKTQSLFQRLVAKNILEKLQRPRTFIIADPMESTSPPKLIPCSRVLYDQSNRSNQILSSPDLTHRTAESTHHPDTPKSTKNIPETATSEITSPKLALQTNKIVIIRRRSNNTPKVLGDSVGTFVKTNTQVNTVAPEEKTPRAIIIRRQRGNVSPRKLEDSPRCQTSLTESAKLTVEKTLSTPNPCNENQGNHLKKEVKNCESNSRGGSIRSTRIVKTQLDFGSRLRRSRK